MNKTYTYSLLQYVHSEVLNEHVNLGILFLFPQKQRVRFVFPQSLKRISGLYKNFADWQIKNYLNAFEKQCKVLNNNLVISAYKENISSLIEKEFIIKECSSLRFSKGFSFGAVDDLNEDQIVNRYKSIYLSEYDDDSINLRHDESYLIKKFQQTLNRFGSIKPFIIHGSIVKNNRTELKCDYKWVNGQVNYIKTLGFDLAEGSTINDKAILYKSKLDYLQKTLDLENSKIDIIVSKPTSVKLIPAYNDALDILSETTAPNKIIQENEIENYVENTAKYLKSKLD